MRMILIHGISQEGKSEQKILEEWITPLRATFARLGNDPLDRLSRIDAAFYGDLLDENSSPWLKSEVLAMGAEQASDDFDEFAVKALEEMALIIGVSTAGDRGRSSGNYGSDGKGAAQKMAEGDCPRC